jgi:flagellar basal body rod protein FlgG
MTVNSLGSQELSYLSSLSASQGYQVLNKGINQAITNFEKTPQAQGDITYFEQNIGQIKTVNQFLGNTRLVDFVLSAFGLDQEDNYQGLIKQVLTQDPNASGSLVNQLTDPRFKQLASALDFFDDGLGRLQAVGLTNPLGASYAEGATLTPTFAASKTASNAASALVTTTAINSSIAIGIGASITGNQYFGVQEPAGTSNTINVSFSDSEYLQVTEADGSTGYTQSGSFTLNSNNQLALADGSVLQPSLTFPTGTTSVNIDSNGNIYSQIGSASPTLVGQLQTATFTDPTQLTTDSNGYYTATSGSGAATVAASTAGAATTTGATAYTQGGYFTVNSSGQLALSNGSILAPDITFPSDTTSVNITSGGVIEANEEGQTIPTVLGQLPTASFTDPTQLTTDALGNYVATTGSGTATVTNSASNVAVYGANSNLQTTVQAAPSGAGVSFSSTAFSVGIGIGGNNYLVLQQTNGAKVYAQAAYFTIDKNNQLALPDGTTLVPATILPTGTTAVTVTSSGQLYAQVTGSKTPTSVGQLEVATFSNPSQLAKSASGYYTPTSGSGSAALGYQTGTSYAFSSSIQSLVNNYVQNEFEVAVGNENTGVREALYFQRTIGPDEATYATYNLATKADVILGDSVLANVAETVLDQPAQIAYQQLSAQEHIIESGIDISKLQTKSYVASLTARYLTQYDISNASATQTSTSPALQILSAFNGGGSNSSSSSSAAQTILSLSV